MTGRHTPVMPAESADALVGDPCGLYLDCTAGLGGHMKYLLESKLAPQGRVIGIELDPEAAALASAELAGYGERAAVYQGSYTEAAAILARAGISSVSGVFFDFGVSSLQLDLPQRGFSFMADGPLDMRFSPSTRLTAADIVNTWPQEQLERILRQYGEERAARRIATAIVAARERGPLKSTLELAGAVQRACPRTGKTHPATRTFQALRITVNGELENVPAGLRVASKLVAPGGRIAALSFHSLEDRLVKREFAALEASGSWKRILKKAASPTEEEQAANPRSRSAKLRAVEKIL
ncbi:MAG TPA: 16S rRNA (cytosine(1402)-N(4))-methyltransferase RsmH [Elusimicrobiales bacterium]|nr:16S rRNA (cytosine(1402)-N(4))-methyltransferase RsmH [Elusimicrobiales bacterium]